MGARGVLVAALGGACALIGCAGKAENSHASDGAAGTTATSGGTSGANAGTSGPGGAASGVGDGSPSASAGTSGRGGASGSSGGTSGAPIGICDALTEAIAAEMGDGICTVVVRMDSVSRRVLSHAFVCGPAKLPDEATARATASADAALPFARPAGEGTLLAPPAPAGVWAFHQPPSDFGGAAAVSATTGLTVFAGSTVWGGHGDILHPTTWSTTDLGGRCHDDASLTPGPAWDLRSGQALADFDGARALGATVLASAFRTRGFAAGPVTALLYTRTAGAPAPDGSEYILLVTGVQ